MKASLKPLNYLVFNWTLKKIHQELQFEHSKTDSEKSMKPSDPPLIVTIPPSVEKELLLPTPNRPRPRSSKKMIRTGSNSQVTAELQTEFLSFREKFFYGATESTTTGLSTKITGLAGKSHDLDIFVMHPCSCFSFFNIFNKQKRQ